MTIYEMYLQLEMKNTGPNFATAARLEAKIFQRIFDETKRMLGSRDFTHATFRFRIPSGETVVWEDDVSRSTYSGEALAAHLIEDFMREIRAQIESRRT